MDYINPITGKPCTLGEYTKACAGGGTTPTTPTTTPTTGATGGNINPYTGMPFTTADLSGMGVSTAKDFWIFYNQGLIQNIGGQYQYVGEQGVVGTGGWGENVPTPYNIPSTTMPTTPTTPPTMPTFGADIPLPEVTPAPPYEKTPEQIAFEEMYSGTLTDWVEAGGYGIPEETQAAMIQQQTDALKARETENLRVMRNTMERRGLTDSGLIWANEQEIRSHTSVAIAGAIADVQIKSALIKLASFETAMGQAGQFLSYLSTQSQLQYAPEFATWQAQQQAKMYQWQGQMDILKLEINQAYQQQNITLTAQLQQQLNTQQHQFELELQRIELEANEKAAKAEGFWGFLGTIFGWIFGGW